MSAFRRFVALLLLLAIGAASVEVLFGAEHPSEDSIPATAGSPDAPADHDEGGASDCACLCACLCPGAQMAVAPALPSFEFGFTSLDVALEHDAPSPGVPAFRLPFRPPLAWQHPS